MSIEYSDVVKRMEPNTSRIDESCAISLRRIADCLEYIVNKLKEEEKP